MATKKKTKREYHHVHISAEAHAALKKLAAAKKTTIKEVVDVLIIAKKK